MSLDFMNIQSGWNEYLTVLSYKQSIRIWQLAMLQLVLLKSMRAHLIAINSIGQSKEKTVTPRARVTVLCK